MMDAEDFEFYLEFINGIIGIGIFIFTLLVFRFTIKNPILIKSYFFLKGGNFSKPFFFLMIGMLVWGLREFYKVLEIKHILQITLFYEITELITALFLLFGILYFYNITRK